MNTIRLESNFSHQLYNLIALAINIGCFSVFIN